MRECADTFSLRFSVHACWLHAGLVRRGASDDRPPARRSSWRRGRDERHLFEDHASGSRDDRPGLAKALAFLRSGDCLVVWKLDRLGRSLPHLLATVNGLKERNVAFRSLTERIDTTSPQGEFLFQVFGALAQFERALARERVKAGLDAAKRRGRHGHRRSTRKGWRRWCKPWRPAPPRRRSAAPSASSAARCSTPWRASAGKGRGVPAPARARNKWRAVRN